MAKKCSVVLRSNAYVVGTSRGNVSTSGVSSLRWLSGVLELEHVALDPPGHPSTPLSSIPVVSAATSARPFVRGSFGVFAV